MSHFGNDEPSLDDLINDPIAQLVMVRDGLDAGDCSRTDAQCAVRADF
jgi:hypothetical protein